MLQSPVSGDASSIRLQWLNFQQRPSGKGGWGGIMSTFFFVHFIFWGRKVRWTSWEFLTDRAFNVSRNVVQSMACSVWLDMPIVAFFLGAIYFWAAHGRGPFLWGGRMEKGAIPQEKTDYPKEFHPFPLLSEGFSEVKYIFFSFFSRRKMRENIINHPPPSYKP